MGDPPSQRGVVAGPEVVVDDAQDDVDVDTSRWGHLAEAVLVDLGLVGELTVTFVDREEITALKVEHFGDAGDHPTDVLSFPIDALTPDTVGVGPVLLGDVVVCPAVAAEQCAGHAGTLEDELALLVVHGILHVSGLDHDDPDSTARMRAVELELLERHHWRAPAPIGFRQGHDDEGPQPDLEGHP